MNDILLITRPKYDDGTEYLSYYSSLILKEANNKNIQTKDFYGERANKDEVTKFIKNKSPKLILINGHGDESSLCGHDNKIIFSFDNITLLKDKIVYARACDAGKALGKEMVKDNDGCFIGYKYPFSFWIDQRWSTKPSNDNIAKLYLEPSNEIILSLIKGKRTQEAYNKSKVMMLDNMRKILKIEKAKEPGTIGMLQILWNNFDGQVLHGNSNSIFLSEHS